MLDNIKDSKAMETKVERYEVASDGETGIVKPVKESAAMGTVTITDLNEIFLIPAPSADPRGWYFAIHRCRDSVLTVAIRSAEHDEVPQDLVHCPRLDFLESGSRAGLRLRWSSHVVHSHLCGGRCYLWYVYSRVTLSAVTEFC